MSNEVWKTHDAVYELDSYNHWYYASFEKFLGKRILDIGSGLGCIFQYYFKCPRELIVAADLSLGNLEELKKRFGEHQTPKAFVHMDIGGAFPLAKLRDYHLDTIVCTNVLEHIEKESETLKNMNAILNQGDRVVIVVPACRMLYGYLDRAAGHFRRYRLDELKLKLEQAGFEVIHGRYLNIPGMFVWGLFNFIYGRKRTQVMSHLEDPGQFSVIFRILRYFNPIISAYAVAERSIPVPWGLSVVCVGQKVKSCS
ncbi:MAG: class I SAM-dependent methyltransferase [Deltaproteobacteria bacterium]|nr:class I SAM-dependent methyltransferase [Deltaproteobacteria bacterium]